ncbi:MAG: sigma-70 family RNA polymerase sigma factor [Deltaproteobacteria bacterium]|nr:sigma-70 family RNA polymerase sigma factor [Deltaproteobacteria bacterium]
MTSLANTILPQPPPHDLLEHEIRTLAQHQRWAEAVSCALRGYGAEILGFLHAVVVDPTEADDIFSALCEKIWRGLPGFRFESTFRTWLYTVARNLAHDRGRARRWRNRWLAEAAGSGIFEVAARVRSTTAVHLRSGTKTHLRKILDMLPPEDRVLFVLRLDREMSWNEIASVLTDDSDDEVDVVREASRLRKRFERVKAKVATQVRAIAGVGVHAPRPSTE